MEQANTDREAYAAALSSMFVLRIERQEIELALDTFRRLSELRTPADGLIQLAKPEVMEASAEPG